MAKVIPEWRKAHKLWSVRLGVLAAIIAGLQPVLSYWKPLLPEWVFASLASIVAVAGVVARLIPQPKVRDDV